MSVSGRFALFALATLAACSKPTPDPPPPALSAELVPAAPGALGARAASGMQPPEATPAEQPSLDAELPGQGDEEDESDEPPELDRDAGALPL